MILNFSTNNIGFSIKQAIVLPNATNERCHSEGIDKLLVDGPLTPSFIEKFTKPQPNAAQGAYNGVEAVSFDITDNPHSGMFVVSGSQATTLRNRNLPRSGFIGPLETAATLTVLQNFPVMKTSLKTGRFCALNRHPSFLHYFNTFPLSPLKTS